MTHNPSELQEYREYRLLAYQQETLNELFHYYANYLTVDEIYPKPNQILLTENQCKNGHYFTKKPFYTNIIILLHILFVDKKGKNHYSRLINTQNQSLINIIEKELLQSFLPEKNILILFQKYLAIKSNTTLENIEREKVDIARYRDKRGAHGDDYPPAMAQDPDKKIIYPKIENLVKYAFEYYSLITRIKPPTIMNNIAVFDINPSKFYTFEEYLKICKDEFMTFWGYSQF